MIGASKLLRKTLISSGLCNFPVRVRTGLARGARWTLFPWSAYWRGGFEPELHATLLGLGDLRGKVCWDLGAHYRIYSVGLAMRTGPTGQVAAFEPNPLSYARLCRHQKMNKLEWLLPFEAAISDRTGEAEIYTYGNLDSTVTHLPFKGEPRTHASMPVAVKLLKLDDLVESGALRLPDLIKIDVEGHAHQALLGALTALKRSKPTIIVAFHSEEEVAGVHAVLNPLGYQSLRIETHSGSTSPTIGHDFVFTSS